MIEPVGKEVIRGHWYTHLAAQNGGSTEEWDDGIQRLGRKRGGVYLLPECQGPTPGGDVDTKLTASFQLLVAPDGSGFGSLQISEHRFFPDRTSQNLEKHIETSTKIAG